MGTKASKKSKSGSQASRPRATAHDSEPATAAASSSEEVRPTKAVKTSISGEASGDEVETTAEFAEPSCDPQTSKFPPEWNGFREIYVQYMPGKPHALTKFGAHLKTHHDRHEFRAIDGTGLARDVGLRNHDVLLSINNLRAGVTNANPLSILECLTDVGPNISLMVERKREEIWLFVFHLDEEGNKPVVKHLFPYQLDHDAKTLYFPLENGVTIPPECSFKVAPVYTYKESHKKHIILKDSDRFMEIDTDKATFSVSKYTLNVNYYENIHCDNGTIPVTISTLTKQSDIDAESDIDPDINDDDDKAMCIKGDGEALLKIVNFPKRMTKPDSKIPLNDMFFHMNQTNTGYTFKAAKEDLYITSLPDEKEPYVWIANLGKIGTEFRIPKKVI